MRFDLGPSIEDLRSKRLADADRQASKLIAVQLAAYPELDAMRALKLSEARSVVQSTLTKASACPLLGADIGVHGATLLEVAQTVIANHETMIARLAEIEIRRMQVKLALRSALTVGEINSVMVDLVAK